MPCSQNSNQSFYADAPNYCRDTPFTGMLHPGKTCYREIPIRASAWDMPSGDQVCFDADGNCDDSFDKVGPAGCRCSDGSCGLSLPGSFGHVFADILPTVSDAIVLVIAAALVDSFTN